MKLISVVIPTYNERENISDGYARVTKIMKQLEGYEYEILYIDNASNDGTRELLRILAVQDAHVKVILNAVNAGWSRSSYYGILNTKGDAVVLLSADMQEPPELIPRFVREWEDGNRIIVGIKNRSKENRFKYWIRQLYYKVLKKIAVIDHIEQFMGFGLYDKSFVDVLRSLGDPLPYLRGMVVEFGSRRKEVEYTQDIRKKGKSHFNFMGMYDLAMLGITSYSRILLRICTFLGAGAGIISFLAGVVTVILKVFQIIHYSIGIAAICTAVFMLGAANLFFLGLLGEYILTIHMRVMNRPLVIEEERMNL